MVPEIAQLRGAGIMVDGVSQGERLERARDEASAPGRTRMASAPAVLERVLRRPSAALALLCLFQIAAWTLFPSLVSFAPPRDTVESYLWGHEWVAGTYKHPNLPGWALETGRLATGSIVWSAYLVSQLFVAATYVCVFMLGREMMGASRALAGTLLLTGVYYTTIPSVMMNHNAAMMPFWAAIAWQLWHARTRPGLIAWAALGVLAALSLYAKLSSGVMLVTAGLWLLYDPALRGQLRCSVALGRSRSLRAPRNTARDVASQFGLRRAGLCKKNRQFRRRRSEIHRRPAPGRRGRGCDRAVFGAHRQAPFVRRGSARKRQSAARS